MSLRLCVMCLADGDNVPAVCVINIGDGDVEAGYCKLCADVMQKNGHKPLPLPAENRQKWTGKLTDAQRAEIINSPEGALKIARRYGVSDATVYNIRKKAKESGVTPAPVELAPAEVEAFERIAVDVLADMPTLSGGPVACINQEVSVEELRRLYPRSIEPDNDICGKRFANRFGEIRCDNPKGHSGPCDVGALPAAPFPYAPEEIPEPGTLLKRVREIAGIEPQPDDKSDNLTIPDNSTCLNRPAVNDPETDGLIVYHISEAKADSIWNTSTVDKKLAFARTELLERLAAL